MTAPEEIAGRRVRGGRRFLSTPEGVPLELELAERGERAAAFLIDVAFMVGAVLVLVFVASSLATSTWDTSWLEALFLLAFFLLRTGYFFGFELAWQGRTPGKRLMGLRVVDRRGGTLSVGAVAARNMLRELEIFLPLSFLALPMSDAVSGWIKLLCLIWAGILTLMPLFNRDRLRIGDMVAGTWVVTARRSRLQQDLSVVRTAARRGRWTMAAAPAEKERRYRFGAAELDVYGVAELQVLEQVLRAPDNATSRETIREVAERIARKIAWSAKDNPIEPRPFLEDYYAALRGHLEHHMLFGDRRADKHVMAGRNNPPSRQGWQPPQSK